MANSSKYNASNPSNLNRRKDQTYFQTKSSNWNKILACHPARNRGEMEILLKAAVRTSISFDVLPNLKNAPDYHQSKIKRNMHHGSGIIHPNYNSNEQTLYTIPVIASGDVLPNLKDAPDYHKSKIKRNMHHGAGIIHPNYRVGQ